MKLLTLDPVDVPEKYESTKVAGITISLYAPDVSIPNSDKTTSDGTASITDGKPGVVYGCNACYNTNTYAIPQHTVTIEFYYVTNISLPDNPKPGDSYSSTWKTETRTVTVPALPAYNPNTAPTITPSSSSLGNIYSAPSLSYTIKDVNNDNVVVTESLNGETKSTTVTGTASGAIVNSNISSWFTSLANGSYTITATATDTEGASSSTSVTFTKVDKPYKLPTVSPTSQDLGSSTSFISAGMWSIDTCDSKSVTYTEMLDNTTILQTRTISYYTNVDSAFTTGAWDKLTYGTHTITMTIHDNNKSYTTSGTKRFTKVNALPTITSDTATELGETHGDPSITYTVTDPDSAYDIHEYVDDVEVTVYPDNAKGSSLTKVAILGYDKLTFENHKFKVVVTDRVTNKTVSKIWTFTKGYNAPVISGSDGDYGTYSGIPDVAYTVYDPDNLSFSVMEYIDGTLTKTYAGLTTPHKASMTIDGWTMMTNGKHTLKIVATNSGNVSMTRNWTITKENKAPEISGNNLNLGNISNVLQYKYTVSDPEGDVFTVVEKIDGSIMRTRSDLTGVQELEADLSDIWSNLAYDKEHVLNIVATDAMSQTSTRTIAFTKVNVAPIAPSFVDLKTGMRRGNKENNFTFNVDVKPGIDYDGDTQYLSLEASTDSKFEENLVTFEPTTYQKKAPDADIWEECGSVSDADVRAGYIYRIPVSGLTENTDWYIRIISTDKNGSGASTKSSPIMISVGDILEIETYPKDCLNNRPIYALVEMNGTIDSQATVTMYICNNAYDATPVWEDCSEAYANSEAYTFKNSQKTAATWAIAVRVKVAANDATGPIAISNLCIAAKRQIS